MDWCSIVDGVLAQLGEHLPYKQRVTGSSPVGPILSIIYLKNGILAQLGEHLPYKQRVTGSSPVGPILLWVVSRVAKGGRL